MILCFKKCAIKILKPIAASLQKAGYPLLRVDRHFPLFTPDPALDSQIDSEDYVMPISIFYQIRKLHEQDSTESHLEEAKLLFQVVLSALAHKNPDIINEIKSIEFTLHIKDDEHKDIIFPLSGFINNLLGRNLVTLRSHQNLATENESERMTLSVTFRTHGYEKVDPWEDIGYRR